MSERIVIDPITRIEGHLRVEAAIEGGKIKEAYSSGTMVRGIENIVRNRDPRDTWVFVGRVYFHSFALLRACGGTGVGHHHSSQCGDGAQHYGSSTLHA